MYNYHNTPPFKKNVLERYKTKLVGELGSRFTQRVSIKKSGFFLTLQQYVSMLRATAGLKPGGVHIFLDL